MSWLRGGALAFTVLAFWLAVILIASPLHQLGFALVPEAASLGALDRAEFDRQIVSYLVTGNTAHLAALNAQEISHLGDVRILWVSLGILALVGAAILARSQVGETDERPARWLVLGAGGASLGAFSSVFLWLHQMIFPNEDWLLPLETSLLTRAYPEAFFLVSWVIVLALSLGTLLLLTKRLR